MKAAPFRPSPFPSLDHLGLRFEARPHATLWVTLRSPRDGSVPYFAPGLLHDLMALLRWLEAGDVSWPVHGVPQPIHYVVLGSDHPDYFSLGGDLRHFHDCIQRRDARALRDYAGLCADMLFELTHVLSGRATTFALVRGRALGGGFETALAADVLVAEEHSELGFPEILFGLFPCTGGMSLLRRRIGGRAAERMLGNGKLHRAAELLGQGIVDEICPTGEGERTVERLIAEHARQRMARLMLQRSRHRAEPLDRAELQLVVDEWVETAMSLGATELRVMEMLLRMQRSRAEP